MASLVRGILWIISVVAFMFSSYVTIFQSPLLFWIEDPGDDPARHAINGTTIMHVHLAIQNNNINDKDEIHQLRVLWDDEKVNVTAEEEDNNSSATTARPPEAEYEHAQEGQKTGKLHNKKTGKNQRLRNTAAPGAGSVQRSSSEIEMPDLSDSQLHFAKENLAHNINHRCGTKKCFFPLSTRSTFGYVVGTDLLWLNTSMWKAYDLARDVIEGQYGMQHLYAGPPQIIPVKKDFAAWLDHRRTGSDDKYRKDKPQFKTKKKVIVQLMEFMQDDAGLLWGCDGLKRSVGWERMHQWLGPLVLQTEADQRQQIRQRFTDSTQALFRLLKDQPCLYYDFQIFVRNSGEIVHFDLDRCFTWRPVVIPPEVIKKYDGYIQKFVTYIQDALQNGNVPEKKS